MWSCFNSRQRKYIFLLSTAFMSDLGFAQPLALHVPAPLSSTVVTALKKQSRGQVGSRGNVSDFFSKNTQFESQLTRLLSWLWYPKIFPQPLPVNGGTASVIQLDAAHTPSDSLSNATLPHDGIWSEKLTALLNTAKIHKITKQNTVSPLQRLYG